MVGKGFLEIVGENSRVESKPVEEQGCMGSSPVLGI